VGLDQIRGLKGLDGVEKRPIAVSKAVLDRWFKDIRPEMTGICAHCGGGTCAFDNSMYKFSIAHILPKNIFRSVMVHPLNWIELCFWPPSCHTNFDNLSLDIIELNCFSLVIDRFVQMYPSIHRTERRFIPSALLQYVEVEK